MLDNMMHSSSLSLISAISFAHLSPKIRDHKKSLQETIYYANKSLVSFILFLYLFYSLDWFDLCWTGCIGWTHGRTKDAAIFQCNIGSTKTIWHQTCRAKHIFSGNKFSKGYKTLSLSLSYFRFVRFPLYIYFW